MSKYDNVLKKEKRKMTEKVKLYKCRGYLFCIYELLELPFRDIAKECGVTTETIRYWLKKHNIKRRPTGTYERPEEQQLQRKKIIDIKEDFYYFDSLKKIPKIPEEYQNQKIWLIVPHKRSGIRLNTQKRLRDFLNERFIIYQLRQLRLRPIHINESIEMTQRESWYYIEILTERDNKAMDSNYKNNFVPAISDYCQKIQEKLGYKYWAYVLDILKIKAKARATIYEEDEEKKGLWKPIGLDKDTLEKYTDAPFFLILCEKEDTITAFLKEIIRKGYNKKYFYCLNLGGESPTNAIRLIRKYLSIRNFHVFVLHDMDIKGLEIFLDMKKHFNCESIGVNPEFLEYNEYDFNELSEDYKNKEGTKLPRSPISLEKGVHTILDELDISIEEKEKYNSWIKMCVKKRIELNSITAHKIESAPSVSKVSDFVDYFIHILEETPWNLTRLRDLKKWKKRSVYRNGAFREIYVWTIKTKINRVDVYPDSIYKFDTDIVESKINEEHKDYLDIIEEIGDIITDNTKKIEEKLENLTNTEKENIDEEIEEIEETYPNIFEGINWREALENKYPGKVKKLNNLVKMSEKQVRFNCIKKHIHLTKQLKNYKGSIKGETPNKEIEKKEKELQTHICEKSGKIEAIRRKDEYNKGLQCCLKETPEYKETITDIANLEEELEERIEKEDNRLEFLETFKKGIEKVFTELTDDLNKLKDETND